MVLYSGNESHPGENIENYVKFTIKINWRYMEALNIRKYDNSNGKEELDNETIDDLKLDNETIISVDADELKNEDSSAQIEELMKKHSLIKENHIRDDLESSYYLISDGQTDEKCNKMVLRRQLDYLLVYKHKRITGTMARGDGTSRNSIVGPIDCVCWWFAPQWQHTYICSYHDWIEKMVFRHLKKVLGVVGILELWIDQVMKNFQHRRHPFNIKAFNTSAIPQAQLIYLNPQDSWKTLISSKNWKLSKLATILDTYFGCSSGTTPLEKIVKKYNIKSICSSKKQINVADEIFIQHNIEQINKYWEYKKLKQSL